MRLIAGLATLLWVLCLATGASAHATLVSTVPADGSVLVLTPKSVQLRFNEAVTPAVVSVIDAAGTTRDDATVRVTNDTIIITLPGNLPRAFGSDLDAVINLSSWQTPAIFEMLQSEGGVEREEMFHVFNMGVGYVLIVRPSFADSILKTLKRSGEKAWLLGEMVKGSGRVVMK